MMDDEIVNGDPNSFSDPDQCSVTDIKLNLEVNFKKKILSGFVDLSVERKNTKADIFLDTKDLLIHSVKNKSTMKKMNFVLNDAHKIFGSKLEIKLPKTTAKRFNIRIEYETSPKASALQWFEPSQTAGKEHPYLLSQCQAIHARSMLPCQDTPGVKTPYSANIIAPFDLVVLMSGIRDGEEMDSDPLMKIFKFIQKVPVPSYLIAIAVGALESRQIGPRSHVWCEKEYIERAAEEFSETEKMICTAEELLGPYIWEVYDILVLPPSFGYGGMENPCLTFVTPTLLAGDKSLVNTIAHEIAHSWTGNLVTNRNFEHFWLNEGFTEFVERKIIGILYGEAHRHFQALQGWKDLEYIVETMGQDNPLTKLVPDLKNVDPEDSATFVPYEKGHTLLFHLEEKLGAVIFGKFLRDYVENYKMKSIDTMEWQNYLYKYFPDKKDILDEVDWNAWLYAPGMPPVKPRYDGSLAEVCVNLCQAWTKACDDDLTQFTPDDLKDMSSGQIQVFIDLLIQEVPLSTPKMVKMSQEYVLENKNSEIRFRWIRLGLRAQWKDIVPQAIKFITEQGRMKFVRPIYRDLFNWDETRELAISTYIKHLPEMMHCTASAIGKELDIETNKKALE